MSQRDDVLSRISEAMRAAGSALVVAHAHPEGDAIGATLGLGRILELMGKRAVCANEDEVPKALAFLPGAGSMVRSLPEGEEFDLVFVLDCGSFDRVGRMAGRIAEHPSVVNIDHHQSNDGFGSITYVDPSASSTGELIWRLARAAGLQVDKDAAMSLYTAIYTDTTRFSNGACTPEAFAACGELMALGADPILVAFEVYRKQTAARLGLLARALSSLRIHDSGSGARSVATISLTQRDFDETGAAVDDLEGFVEQAHDITGIKVAALARETADGRVKVSLRSDGSIDVNRLAQGMGGGGHRAAAGLTVEGSLDSVLDCVVRSIRETVD